VCDNQCGVHGTCNDSTGLIVCACSPGYAGNRCDLCAAGFHLEGGSCVLNEQCQADSCAASAECDDTTGKISCLCHEGYIGDECDGCADGYYRNPTTNQCVLFVCGNNPISAMGTANWDARTDFPKYQNNCVSGLNVATDAVSFKSRGGSGGVWACSVNTVYAIATHHIYLEASATGPAQIVFSGPVASVSFEYGARSALNLAIEADGVVIDTLTAARKAHGTMTLTFPSPTTVLGFRSTTSGSSGQNQLAIDNLTYTPPACQ
jgi:hypothetical protein